MISGMHTVIMPVPAMPPWITAMSTSNSLAVNKHILRDTLFVHEVTNNQNASIINAASHTELAGEN